MAHAARDLRRLWRWLAGAVVLVALLAAGIALFPWDWLRGPVSRYVSEHTGRQFEITRRLDVDLGWTTRVIDATSGAEAMRLGVVQRYLLRTQQITPNDEAQQIILSLGHKSAFDVVAVPKEAFVERFVDEYFRRFSGHTQVNATDLRMLKYPSLDILCTLGCWVKSCEGLTQEKIDQKVASVLWPNTN